MEARTLLYKLMVISPIGFIAWIGVMGRFSQDTFEFTTTTTKQDAAIDLYRFPLAASQIYPHRLSRHLPDEALVIVTDLWRAEFNRGHLGPIFPAEHGHSVREGVASEIKDACVRVIDMNIELAARALRRDDFDAAAGYYQNAYQLTTRLKYSDPAAVIIFSGEQSTILNKVLAIRDRVSPATKARWTSVLKAQNRTQPGLEIMGRHLDTLYAVYRRNREKPFSTSEPATVLANARTRADEIFASERGPEVDLKIAAARDRAALNQVQRVLRTWNASSFESKAPANPKPSVQLASLTIPPNAWQRR